MQSQFPLLPEAASTLAPEVDRFYFFMVAISGVLTLIVVVLAVGFAVKYRRRPGHEQPIEYKPLKGLEWGFIVVLFTIFMGMFFYSARMYFNARRPPSDSMEIYVSAKQWMWKFQHTTGQSEINELHVPVNRPVRLVMSSEDVIHSLFFPAFRQKMDVLPNRYTYTWFEATKPGRYHLFCTEYCGTEHSGMIGTVIVMPEIEFQNWLAGGQPETSPAVAGQQLFQQYACVTCHAEGSGARGPNLTGVFRRTEKLRGGGTVVADENYLRESILNPNAKVVDGYDPIMPSFQGQLNEAQIMQLVSYLKTLTTNATPAGGAQFSAPAPATGPSTRTTPAGDAPAQQQRDSKAAAQTDTLPGTTTR